VIVNTHFTAYKFAAMLSAALSRIHDLPPLLVLKRTPLPPAAQASSCIHNFANLYIKENKNYSQNLKLIILKEQQKEMVILRMLLFILN
jgi:hypothetical protein